MQAMHDKLDGQGQRIKAMAKTTVTTDMIMGILSKIFSGMKLSFENLLDEYADSTEKKQSCQSLYISAWLSVL
jgi:hypothetical protein